MQDPKEYGGFVGVGALLVIRGFNQQRIDAKNPNSFNNRIAAERAKAKKKRGGGPKMCAVEEDENPVLMRVVFKEGTTSEAARELIRTYPFDKLRGLPYTEDDGNGALRFISRTEEAQAVDASDGIEIGSADTYEKVSRGDATEDGLYLDGGLLFSVVSNDGDLFLDISRLNDGRPKGALPAVIREKQTMKKVTGHLGDMVSSSRIRAFGSGSF